MATHMGFRCVHPCRLDVPKSIPRAMETPPKIQVPQDRLAFDGFQARSRSQWLKMSLADQRGMEACGVQHPGQSRHILEEFCSE
jgi:hypothetical protein